MSGLFIDERKIRMPYSFSYSTTGSIGQNALAPTLKNFKHCAAWRIVSGRTVGTVGSETETL